MSTTEIPQLRDGTETVDPSATVGEQVTMIGYARVLNMASAVSRAKIINGAKVIDTAAVHDNAEIIEHAIVYGNARVFGSAVVDGAEVGGNAYVGDHARIHGNAVVNAGTYDLACDVAERNHFVTVGPIGSEGRTATFFRSYAPDRQGWVGIVAAGCFRGSVDKLEARLDKGEAWSPYNYSTERIARYDAEYSAFIALARVKESSWGPITDPDRSWWEKRLTTQVDGPWLVQRLREFGGA